jgi:hypothetical protein
MRSNWIKQARTAPAAARPNGKTVASTLRGARTDEPRNDVSDDSTAPTSRGDHETQPDYRGYVSGYGDQPQPI